MSAAGVPDFTYEYPLPADNNIKGLHYGLIDGHIILFGGKCGKLAVRLDNIPALAKELMEYYKVWSGVRT
jgi:hypothetical protein